MNGLNLIKQSIVSLACLGMVIPQCQINAAGVDTGVSQKVQVADVALSNGQLTGKVVDTQGKTLNGVKISASLNGQVVAASISNEKGEYTLEGLQTGLYEIQFNEESGNVRLWSEGAIPPSAKSDLLIVSGLTERGQLRLFGFGARTSALLIGGAIVAIAVPVAIANNDDDDPVSP